jgi:hypothetical protein
VKTVELVQQEKLTPDRVKMLVLRSAALIRETRDELNLPLFRRIEDTQRRLEHGTFRAEPFPVHRLSHFAYAKVYGYFRKPSTIVLEEALPLSGKLFDQPLLATTATYYCATHEVIHADDYTNNNGIIKNTLRHIRRKHKDELAEASEILSKHSKVRWTGSENAIINTWTYQFADAATHYRTFLVLKHKKFPKIDNIWVSLYNSIFSPSLFTTIEDAKGLQYTTSLLSKHMGKICIIEIVKMFEAISRKKTDLYTA